MRSVTGYISEIFEEILSKHELMNFRFANYRLKNIHIFFLRNVRDRGDEDVNGGI